MAKLKPIRKTIIGLTEEIVEKLSKELNICIETDMGTVCFEDNLDYREYTYEECEEIFLDAVKEKYNVELPRNYDDVILFAADGDQDFDFYIGIMF